MRVLILVTCMLYLFVGSNSQSCDSRQFAVRNSAGEDYLTINSPTEVKTCGGINICDEIRAGKQALALYIDGTLSISDGNSVKLPDVSSTNEIQTLNIESLGQLSISNGNSVSLPDNSATNEIQKLSLDSDSISLSNGGGSITLPDASATNELQNLDLDSSGRLSISEGNSVNLPDNSATNEIQTLTLDASLGKLTISGGNSVSLPDNSATNEIQTLSHSADTVYLSNGGGSVTLPDASATNELQTLSVDNTRISISNGNTVQLPSVWSYRKFINFTTPGIAVTSRTWISVSAYELFLSFPSNFSTVQISLNIPYSGVYPGNTRGRVQLVFDSSSICDVTMYPNSGAWYPIYLQGIVQNVQAGNHLIQVKAFADANTLFIPAYDAAQVPTHPRLHPIP